MPVDKSHSEKLDIIESELNSVLEQDSKYWRENDAKFRAVAQNVSYEQFEEIVKASHLKPLDKSDKNPSNSKSKSSIWNSIANVTSRRSLTDDRKMESCASNRMSGDPKNVDEFFDAWRNIQMCERIKFLHQLGEEKLKKIFVTEVPSELLVDFLYTFLTFDTSSTDIVVVVKTLELLTSTKRFSLSCQFLSSVEKQAGEQLIEKLRSSLLDREQDLAELGVTEWNIENIAKKFKFE